MNLSWVEVEKNSDFPLQNIPFGIMKVADRSPRVVTRIGDYVIDLYELSKTGFFDRQKFSLRDALASDYLNDFISLGKPVTRSVRQQIIDLFKVESDFIRDNAALRKKIMIPAADVQMLMPLKVGDYTDFYSSLEHASNVGKMFRDASNPLLPNWKHMPVGYHGRSSSIVVSGTPIYRPKGQLKSEDQVSPEFGPSRQLDFELEMAFVTGVKTNLGERISVENAEDAIFGMVLFNDLSARDLQKWEYVPLGPFLGKSFGSVISPWVVTLEALEPFRMKGPEQDVPVLPYLKSPGNKTFDIQLEVYIRPGGAKEAKVCSSNFSCLYWNISQQLAHQTVNGCNINVGDLYASGTISGSTHDSYGSMLEIAWKGTKPVELSDGLKRTFLEDGDTVIMRGFSQKSGLRIGFGEVSTKVLPAI
jgi:fumarylacetoacetase